MKVKSIKNTGIRKPVWDLNVPDAEHFFMENGCITHNSNVTGSYEMFEPADSNLFNRRVIAGEMLIVNKYMIDDFEKLGLWSEQMKNEIIMNNGSLQNVNFQRMLDPEDKNYSKKVRKIEHLVEKYKTVWEYSQKDLMNLAADRGPFIDQTQSMNLYMTNPTVSKLTSAMFYSWRKGLKTGNYYIRTKAVSTGAKHLAFDVSSVEKKEEIQVTVLTEKPENSMFDCFGCSA